MLRKNVRLGYPRAEARGYSYLKGFFAVFSMSAAGQNPLRVAQMCSHAVKAVYFLSLKK